MKVNFSNLTIEKYIQFDQKDDYKKRNNKLSSRNYHISSSLEIYKSKNSYERKFIVLFLIFIQILSEVSSECKERGVLLYKFFKIYFVEQEKKWVIAINTMKDKIYYYKQLCKTIIQQKNFHIDKIEDINDVLFTSKLSKGTYYS